MFVILVDLLLAKAKNALCINADIAGIIGLQPGETLSFLWADHQTKA